jgi:hypothetical protein
MESVPRLGIIETDLFIVEDQTTMPAPWSSETESVSDIKPSLLDTPAGTGDSLLVLAFY